MKNQGSVSTSLAKTIPSNDGGSKRTQALSTEIEVERLVVVQPVDTYLAYRQPYRRWTDPATGDICTEFMGKVKVRYELHGSESN